LSRLPFAQTRQPILLTSKIPEVIPNPTDPNPAKTNLTRKGRNTCAAAKQQEKVQEALKAPEPDKAINLSIRVITAALGTETCKPPRPIPSKSNQPTHPDTEQEESTPENILELRGLIPLPILDKVWQARALIWHLVNHLSLAGEKAEKNLRYYGLTVPDEYAQSHSDWMLN
ncbi:hypothetical protein MJO28_001756, partial [Puccinia striiformis f. sp. tritici]